MWKAGESIVRRIISLTMVGNECEMIESFVRYNSNFVNKMYFISNSGTVDKTIDILKKLQDEGYDITLYDEPTVSYDQKVVENKYLRLIASSGDSDIIIPLDADEFITTKEEHGIKEELDSLDLNSIYLIGWRNYDLTQMDDLSESFIPRRICYCSKEMSIYTKVIIPTKLVNERGISVTTGHHSIKFNKTVNIINHERLYIAHYPRISYEQYISKIYCSCINFITWMNRANGEGSHINKALSEIDDINFYENFGRRDYDGKNEELIYLPLSLKECKNIDIKYNDLAKVNPLKNIVSTGQVMAIKAYNLEINKFNEARGIKVLVFGTGYDSNHLLDGFPADIINIQAYLDSDKSKEYTMFNRRLVVTPEKCRLFSYDMIIIASSKYYDEMFETLRDLGVDMSLVVGVDYLLDIQIKTLNK